MSHVRLHTHAIDHPAQDPPPWADRVPRWQQIDAVSYAVADAWWRWRGEGVGAAELSPDAFLLANPAASNAADAAFAQGGAFSPGRFVATLPSVTLSSMLQMTGWLGPMVCVQNGARTLLAALAEAEVLGSAGAMGVGIVSYEMSDGASGGTRVAVRYLIVRNEASTSPAMQDAPALVIQRWQDVAMVVTGDDDDLLRWLAAPLPRRSGAFVIGPERALFWRHP
jgi:hypothetical protein